MAFNEPRIDVLLARTSLSGEGAIIEVEGNLDQTSSELLETKIAEVAGEALKSPTRILLDISRLKFVDFEGLASILRAMEELRAVTMEFDVLYPSPMTSQFLELCGFLQIFGIKFGPPLESREVFDRSLHPNSSSQTKRRSSETAAPQTRTGT